MATRRRAADIPPPPIVEADEPAALDQSLRRRTAEQRIARRWREQKEREAREARWMERNAEVARIRERLR